MAEFDYRHTTRKASDAHRVEMLFDRFADRRPAYKDLIGAI
jgi:hypothetical protein